MRSSRTRGARSGGDPRWRARLGSSQRGRLIRRPRERHLVQARQAVAAERIVRPRMWDEREAGDSRVGHALDDRPRRARRKWPVVQDSAPRDRPPVQPAARVPGMAELIALPVTIEAAGDPPKLIEEFVGRASTGEERVSVARMRSPAGWSEPGQRPDFDEYTVVLGG